MYKIKFYHYDGLTDSYFLDTIEDVKQEIKDMKDATDEPFTYKVYNNNKEVCI